MEADMNSAKAEGPQQGSDSAVRITKRCSDFHIVVLSGVYRAPMNGAELRGLFSYAPLSPTRSKGSIPFPEGRHPLSRVPLFWVYVRDSTIKARNHVCAISAGNSHYCATPIGPSSEEPD